MVSQLKGLCKIKSIKNVNLIRFHKYNIKTENEDSETYGASEAGTR